ncbi:MAG: hypothetical protein ACD_50C00213G0005 [uncultured bacterium]|nr:MAG: hypothetical protein ACD_50C00213G0005 [uncultured bacterium]OGH13279.1 MAG: hypothetical protein A2687_04005 [Candidatus Levybacteria bacterium RIFCSPHIGHO2_01_FULL_38_26]
MDGVSEVKELDQIATEDLALGSENAGVKLLKAGLNGLFQGEKKIGDHRVEIKFFNSKHRSAFDIKGLRDQLQEIDIYIPEVFGWESEYLSDLRKLSSGGTDVEQMLEHWGAKDQTNYERDREFFEVINNSRKAITIIDVPGGHPLVDRADGSILPKIKFGSDFNESLNSMRDYLKNLSAIEKERGSYMLEHLKPKIQEVIDSNPELAEKEKLSILIDIGVANTHLYHDLKKDFETSREISTMPMQFLYREEVMRRYIFDKLVDDELIARTVTEYLISKANKKRFSTNFSTKDVKLTRSWISKFSLDEMKNMFNESQNMGEWTDRFYNKIREKRRVTAADN